MEAVRGNLGLRSKTHLFSQLRKSSFPRLLNDAPPIKSTHFELSLDAGRHRQA